MNGTKAGGGGKTVGAMVLTVLGFLGACAVLVAGCGAVVMAVALHGIGDVPEKGCRDSEVDLIQAAATNRIAVVRKELKDGEDPSQFDEAGNSALACAGPRGHLEVVKVLLAAGARADSTSRDGDSLLADAVKFCQPQVARLLLKAGAKPDRSGHDDSLLTLTVQDGRADMVEVLLDGGADPKTFARATEGFGNESTSDCPETTNAGQTASLLLVLGAGADPSAVLGAGMDDLSPKAVDAALAKGADPDAPAAGWPLATASARGDAVLVARLLAAGADPNRGPSTPGAPGPGSSGSTTTSSTTSTTDVFSMDATEILCHNGSPTRCDPAQGLRLLASQAATTPASTTTTTSTGRTTEPSSTSTTQPAGDEAGSLLAQHVTSSPLVQAAWTDRPEVVRLLLGAGADPGLADSEGFTAFHAAAGSGSTGVILLLLEAQPEPARTQAVPPSAIATAAGHPELAATLASHGI